MMQIFYRFHADAYEDRNVIRSSAYNLDYAMQFWRGCFDGDYGWLNDYPRGRRYRPGDALG